ncbi:MAG TPA: tRNA 5-methoxyuridine(34)/uridine 5-oxyacetic acid(34) synthase CmoB [Woeseiaceae bacterium]|nr:tRNA 5-methoxyuridine(34)/uridine 5-oxyacetic acid(34) synthase CmoB [Woeseiaceae bacterium]
MSSDVLLAELAAAGFAHWRTLLLQPVAARLREGVHGQLAHWNELLLKLPRIETGRPVLHEPVVRVAAAAGDSRTAAALREQFLELSPWRKGPFHLCGVDIDSEWRSDLKWSRVAPAISPLEGRLVLDVGCGNGYYGLRMCGQGAAFVLGIDPTLLYLVQFRALQFYIRETAVQVLPLRLSELPLQSAFDTAFSMGVLYHQRDPLQHLQELHAVLRPGGELVLETLILPGDEVRASTPPDRYARMRNVWQLPTLPTLVNWLGESGFSDPRVADLSITSTDEQRPTDWMRFESLQQALDPENPELTVEGWPRPRRAVLVSRAIP